MPRPCTVLGPRQSGSSVRRLRVSLVEVAIDLIDAGNRGAWAQSSVLLSTPWCKGSTGVFGTSGPGSNPGGVTFLLPDLLPRSRRIDFV